MKRIEPIIVTIIKNYELVTCINILIRKNRIN